ncbi:MAG: hypothetical protein Q9191_006966, partial [Dirinaria sp. TL-2023a]
MQLLLLAASVLLATITAASTSAAPPSVQPSVIYIPPEAPSEAPVTRIFKYNGVLFENLAFRSNGQLLATTAFPSGLLFYIDPLSIRPGIVLHNFTSLASTGGITELSHDVFYIAGSGADGGPPRIYSVDIRPVVVLPDGTIFRPPVIREVASVPSAALLNGMAAIRRSDRFVLVADTLLGGVWKVHVDTGKSELIIKDPSMTGPANQTAFAAFVFFTHHLPTLFARASSTSERRGQGPKASKREKNHLSLTFSPATQLHADGSSAGSAKLVTSGIACDDFALDPQGFAYVASPRNALIKLDTATGAQLVVAGTFNRSTSDII